MTLRVTVLECGSPLHSAALEKREWREGRERERRGGERGEGRREEGIRGVERGGAKRGGEEMEGRRGEGRWTYASLALLPQHTSLP